MISQAKTKAASAGTKAAGRRQAGTGSPMLSRNGNGARIRESDVTDTANGERLAVRYGNRLRYVSAWGWLVWDGRRWATDGTGELYRLAKDTARAIYNEAAKAAHDTDSWQLGKWAKASLSRSRLESMITLAQSEDVIAARPEEFDANPWLLNCANGILDLRTGQLSPSDPTAHLTRLAPTIYDPAAKCPLWERFLDRIFDHNEPLIGFVQRAIGYSATGDTSEQCLLIPYGTGANGKSTLLETIRAILGDYAQQAEFSSFVMRQGEGPRNDIARMAGARLVAAVESGEGRRLDEPMIKVATGGDTITARLLYREHFEFKPQFKMWLGTNHKPVIRGTDNAIWRRIRLIPFNVTIPPTEQDHRLAEILRGELPGILAWAVRGCLDWQRDGLGMPPEVEHATAAYRVEQDELGGFLTECCIERAGISVRTGELFSAYEGWGGEEGRRQFGIHLRERGFTPGRTPSGVRIWLGLGLLVKD